MSSKHIAQLAGLVVLAICCVLIVPAMAGELQKTEHTFEVAPELSWIQYSEPGLMEDEGWMYGIGGSYICRGPLFAVCSEEEIWMLRGDARYAQGEVDYDGALWDGTPYTINNIEDYTWEARALIGFDATNEVARVTPFTGIGFRYLNNDASFDPAGYERESHYLYVPFGFEVLFHCEGEWTVGGSIEYDLFAWGEQKSHLGDVNPAYDTVENRQRHGDGMKASIRLQQQGNKMNFGLEPFVRFWNVGDSEVFDGVVEPKNRSVEVGLKLVFQFK